MIINDIGISLYIYRHEGLSFTYITPLPTVSIPAVFSDCGFAQMQIPC